MTVGPDAICLAVGPIALFGRLADKLEQCIFHPVIFIVVPTSPELMHGGRD